MNGAISARSNLTSRTHVGGMLLVSLVRVPEPDEWSALRQEVLNTLQAHRVNGVVMDLDQAEVLDDVDLKELLHTRATIRLMGLEMVMSGLRPEVVHAWVRMTEVPPGLEAHATVEDAIASLQRSGTP